jgi:hypothetical protein
MADDESLKIKVEIDDADAQRKLKEEAKLVEAVGQKASTTYKAVGQAADQSASTRVSAAKRAAEGDTQALEQSRDAFGRFTKGGQQDLDALGASSNNLLATFQKFGASAISIGTVVNMYKGMVGAMREATVEAEKQVDHLLKLKNTIRDIAAMTGSTGGSTDAEVSKFMKIRKASGLDDAGAKGFVQGYAGSGEAKKGINISEEEYEKGKPLIARFAAANSAGDAGAAESYGNMAGLVMGYDKNITSGKLLSKVTGVTNILNKGVGDNPTLLREYSQQAGSLLNAEGTGYGGDPNKVAALISTSSIQRSAGQAGTVVQQAAKSLRNFTGPQAGMLSGAGITEKDDMIAALGKLFKVMEEAEKKGEAPDQFLAKGGIESNEDRMALTALYAGRSYLNRFVEEGKREIPEAEARAQLEEKFRSDSALQANQAQAKLDEAKANNAMQRQHVKPLQLEAQAALEARGEGMDSPSARAQDKMRGDLSSLFGTTLPPGITTEELGRKFREEEEMNAQLERKGGKVPNRPNPTSPLGGYSGDYTAWIAGGGYMDDYATATSTDFVSKQVGGPRPQSNPNAPGRVGNDENWSKVVGAIQKQTTQLKADPGLPQTTTRTGTTR